ncbi:MAG: hypothetical protein JXA69_08230 [Phycisphaerae bacterium]|nr:hypothetical protein [Phycisphaerae bacterium]
MTFDVGVLELFDQYGNDIPDFEQADISGTTIIVPGPSAFLALLISLLAPPAMRRCVRPGAP